MANGENYTQITREAPDIEARRLGLIDSAKALAEQPLTLPDYTLAGFQSPETTAFNLSNLGIGAYEPLLNQAQQAILAGQGTTAGTIPLLTSLSQTPTSASFEPFQSNFQQAVIDQTLKQLDEQAAQQQTQLSDLAQSRGAFGGSRQGVAEALLGEGLQDAKARAIAGLNQQSFENAQAAFARNQELQRLAALGIGGIGGQQAGFASVLQNLAGQQQAQRGQDISQLLGIGGLQRQQAQAGLDIDRQNVLQNIFEPYQRIGFYGDVLAQAPSSQQTLVPAVSPGVSPLQQAVGVGIGALSGIAGLRRSGVV
mgnify:CR=1 FL=1